MRRQLLIALSILAACSSKGQDISTRTTPAEPGAPSPASAAPLAPGEAPTGFSFKLIDVTMKADAEPSEEAPVAYRTGEGKLLLIYSVAGQEKTVEVETLGLESQGAMGNGERFELDPNGALLPGDLKPEDFSEEEKKALRDDRPRGAVASAGFFHSSTRAMDLFILYSVVPVEGRRYQIVSQLWSEGKLGEGRVVKELEL
jgi:hypothetical protein